MAKAKPNLSMHDYNILSSDAECGCIISVLFLKYSGESIYSNNYATPTKMLARFRRDKMTNSEKSAITHKGMEAEELTALEKWK